MIKTFGLTSLLATCAVGLAVATSGCGGSVRVRTYDDPYYHDRHRWDDHETVYYNQWTTETHRDNRDFRKLNHDEQKQYWDWRHSHDHP
jgi:hypothetical protein